VTVVLDAGALVAVERRDRFVGSMLRLAQHDARPVVTSGAVVAQVWRGGGRQALVARLLAGVRVAPLDLHAGRQVGGLLAQTRTSDVVDGHVAHLAVDGAVVLTSDPDDLGVLLAARGVAAEVLAV
jgi:hypothetical protein